MAIEKALLFECDGDELVGIVHIPPSPHVTGVLVVVGGPQYRVGAHRQFLLLSRSLAQAGFAVLRFDHRGIGDSSGRQRSFETISHDIECAIDAMVETCPQVKQVHIWALCDGASAASLYAPTDPRVAGLVLLNPWVRSETGFTRSFLLHYYIERLFDRKFWHGAFKGRKRLLPSVKSAIADVFSGGTSQSVFESTEAGSYLGEAASKPYSKPQSEYQLRMLSSLQKFRGRILIILSGNDLTAAEFRQMVSSNRKWTRLLDRSSNSRFEIPDANHTFSNRAWRNTVAESTLQWLRSE